ncbi:hypothetical protein AB0P16_18310 [Dietzia maris]|jgi:hypothetical protein|uniref:hypothetical protein n=1 Tax=Dietzia TaxID=37914 RepID=UPI001357BD63|nr:hypothetical protein [Dietzia sp. WMMA184]
MGSEAFEPTGSIGMVLGEGGPLGILNEALGWMGDLASGLGYFLGGDFQEAFDAGFMA